MQHTSTTPISFDDFLKVDTRAGTILTVTPNVKAKKPAYVLTIDFGDLGIKTSSAQITDHYTPEQLIGTQIIAVVNFEPKRIAGVVSEVLVLGCACPDATVVLLRPTQPVANGSRVF